MSIQELVGKFKTSLSNTEYLLTALIIVVSLVSFRLGQLSAGSGAGQGKNIDALQPAASALSTASGEAPSAPAPVVAPEGGYVASKNGTRYHLPWCSGARQMSQANKIFFATKEEAEAAGYTPASNCKGI